MADTEVCPHCGADLNGEPVDPAKVYTEEELMLPWDQRPLDKYYAPGTRYLRRAISHEIRGIYDGILFWQCPDCRGAWHDWTPAYGMRYTYVQDIVAVVNRTAGVTV